MQLRHPISDQKSEKKQKLDETFEDGGEIIISLEQKFCRDRDWVPYFLFKQPSLFQLQPPVQGVSEEDLQYLDEISVNILSVSNANLSNHPFADSSNYISGNFSTMTQVAMVEVLGSKGMAGISTTPSYMAMCDFSAIKVTLFHP